MIRSHPLPSFHSADIFKFNLDAGRRSPITFDSHDELQSNHSSHDEEPLSSPGEYFHEIRTSSTEDDTERPLNLSCKRRKVDNTSAPMTPQSNSSSELNKDGFPKLIENSDAMNADSKYHIAKNEAVETAILHYRAQILASNEFIRFMVQRRLQEEISSAFGRPLVATASVGSAPSQWIPVESQLYTSNYMSTPVENSHGSSMEHVNRNEANDVNASNNKRFFSSPSHSSASASPMASPTLSSEIYSEVKPLSTCSPPTFLFPNGRNISPSSLIVPQTLMHESTDFLRSNVSDASQHDADATSPVTSESSLSPSTEGSRKRRRSKRTEGSTVNHNGDSYPCSICGASYPHKFELNRHVKVSHVRPHRCSECGKGFGHRNYLKVHIETVHMGQKSHQCRLCGKYLSTGGNLNVHVRTIHMGEKKYNCPVCNRSFGQQCNMKTHMKRHYSKSVDELM